VCGCRVARDPARGRILSPAPPGTLHCQRVITLTLLRLTYLLITITPTQLCYNIGLKTTIQQINLGHSFGNRLVLKWKGVIIWKLSELIETYMYIMRKLFKSKPCNFTNH